MNQDTGPNQAEPAEVPEVAQSACTTPPTETSTAPVRVRQTRKPKPRPEPVPAPMFIEPMGIDWDEDLERIGHALAAELEGGAA